ncbi:hypothetical protein [Flavobacterium piscisymbiosum]|uniref:Uncharacterized protein n=1 Tax=Flavobacterium piscisymbiosum TaxID=2893753 RepID=A0ABS8MDX5_9FLAO|nr:hypothetical protein [Flavobacterium sp. F-30]MCC9063623.1 hypothetical protein [Flavobacterium sp. F-30]
MKALLLRELNEKTLISIELNEFFLYHLNTGIQAVKDLKPKLKASPKLSIPISDYVDFTIYALGNVFSRELENGNITVPRMGIEYLLLKENSEENIVFSKEQKQQYDWLTIEYSDDYYDNTVHNNYFKNLKKVNTNLPYCEVIIYETSFQITVFDPIGIRKLISEEIDYSIFESEVKNDLDLIKNKTK